MIVSALISQCRREFRDTPKRTQAGKASDGVSTIFNLGKAPIVEGSYSVLYGTSAKVETTNYTLDKDSGDLDTITAVPNGIIVKANYKYANFRDANWVEAINQGIEYLNARGFFRQVVRNSSIMRLSAGVRVYNGPSACVDLYEVLKSDTNLISGTPSQLPGNFSYQQDANKLVIGYKPSAASVAWISYLRNLQTYSATSATLDCLNDWVEIVKKKAGAVYFRSLAAKIATEGAATIDEGHFSFTNLRTMANDLETEAERLAIRKKPTRPAKSIGWHIPGSEQV